MKIRQTARLFVIDEQERILLFKVNDGQPVHVDYPDLVIFWITPWGGVEVGETFEQAACRELWEETGIAIVDPGPWVWQFERTLAFSDGQKAKFQERFFLLRVKSPTVTWENLLAYEASSHTEFRWWTRDEIATSNERFLPPDLPNLLDQILI